MRKLIALVVLAASTAISVVGTASAGQFGPGGGYHGGLVGMSDGR